MKEEIFSRIAQHQLEGIMFHAQMADYYDFLGLEGFKRMHEYHFREEITTHRRTCSYYVEHYSKLIPETVPKNPDVIPESWYGHVRKDVDQQTLRQAIEEGHEKWIQWEQSTKALYEAAYRNLMEEGSVAGAIVVERLVEDVDEELAGAEQQLLELRACDLPTIIEMQRTA